MTKWRKFKQDFVGCGGQVSEIYCNFCRHPVQGKETQQI